MEHKDQTLVMKFGGTSVGSISAMAQAAKIIKDARAEWGRVVVVTSAISGATNALLDSATHAASGDLQILMEAEKSLLERHQEICKELVADPQLRASVIQDIGALINTFGALCRAIAIL